VVFCKVVAVAPARVRRDGRVQAQGSPCDHATLGPQEDWLEQQAGPGVIDGIAGRAVLREEHVKGAFCGLAWRDWLSGSAGGGCPALRQGGRVRWVQAGAPAALRAGRGPRPRRR
jgi:hypothetical protein